MERRIEVGRRKGNSVVRPAAGTRILITGLGEDEPVVRRGNGGYYVEAIAKGRTTIKRLTKPTGGSEPNCVS